MRWANDDRKGMLGLAVTVITLATGGIANADFTFGEPTNLGPVVNFSPWQQSPFISADGLSLYFSGGPTSHEDLWMTERDSAHADWGKPTNLGAPINTPLHEFGPSISPDGLELYFHDAASSWGYTPRSGGLGECDIWVSTRPTQDHPWTEPENLGNAVNSSSLDGRAKISFDGLTLYFSSNRPGGFGGEDIWMTQRATTSDPWGEPVNLGSVVNSAAPEEGPSVSADGLALFFNSNRPGGYGLDDLYMATRTTINDPWGTPVNLGPRVNTGNYGEVTPCISADGLTLYFGEFPNPRPGGYGRRNIWQTSLVPIVDFNGDGKVDGFEVGTMADHWETNDPLCDIGPMPWGDGVVDLEDLTILAEYIGEELDDPTLVAHWAFDETEGGVACDSAGGNDGTVMGVPAWQPDGGKVGGAMEFDGVTFVVAGFVLDPSDGPFSVLAWVKGGAPGQAVISQVSGVNWLMADELSGTLMTELRAPTRDNQRLVSETVITDGDWHRVAFVWDGINRILYADGALVASDIQSSLGGCAGSLIFGRSSAMAPGTSWTGLIDDVRIYNRAVRP